MAHLLGKLTAKLESLAKRYNKAVTSFRRSHEARTLEEKQPFVVCHVDAHASRRHVDAVLEDLRLGVEDLPRTCKDPLTRQELIWVGEMLRADAAARLQDICLDLGYFRLEGGEKIGQAPPHATASAMFQQLKNTFPVIGLEMRANQRGQQDATNFVLVSQCHPDSSHVLLAAMASSQDKYKQLIQEEEGEDEDVVEDVDKGEDVVEDAIGKRGRKSKEEEFGQHFLDFMYSLIMTRGEMKLADRRRMRDTVDSYDFPLSAMADAAKNKGFKIEKTAVWSLFEKRRKNLKLKP